MCFSANWGHLKDGLKRRDYEKKRQQEEDELEEINAGYINHENPNRAHHRNTGPAVMVPESYEMRTGGRGGGGGGGGGGPRGERPPHSQMNGYY